MSESINHCSSEHLTSVHWKTAGQSKQGYNYTYDYRSWLMNADYFESGKNGRYSTSYVYKDKRGNFDKIMRMGMMNGTAGQIDNLNFGYHPSTNLIRTISDGAIAAVKSGGYKSNVGDYSYNDNAAMDHDPSRGAVFTLNFMDLPDEISIPDSSGSIQYLYDASGVYHGQLEIRHGKTVASRYHIGSVEYDDGIVDQIMTSQGYVELEYAVPTQIFRTGVEPNTTQQGISVKSEASVINNRNVIYEGGQYVCLDEAFTVDVGGDFEAWIKDYPPTSFSHRFIIKDHLGSARIIFSDLDKDGSVDASEIINHFEYYPFGSLMEGDWNDNSKYNHLFTGQERQKRFGLGYDRYQFRMADPLLGRFLAVDPLAEDYTPISPYAYVANNPISFIDPDGMRIDVSQAQQYDKDNGTDFLQQIISDLTEQTGLTFSVNGGFLEYSKDGDGNSIISTDTDGNQLGSSIARGALMNGIDHSDTGSFNLVESGGSSGSGLNFQVDINETQGFIDGSSAALNDKTMGFGMMFTHELLHTDIGLGIAHGREAYDWGLTGRVLGAMNGIRSQMGADYGQRLSYLGFGYNGATYLPFDKGNKNLIYNQIRTVQRNRNPLRSLLSPVNGKFIKF